MPWTLQKKATADPAARKPQERPPPTLDFLDFDTLQKSVAKAFDLTPSWTLFLSHQKAGPLRSISREPAQNASEGSPGGIRQPRKSHTSTAISSQRAPSNDEKNGQEILH